jgi:glyoxalase family protein
MTYFPFGQMPKRRRGTGVVGATEFAVPKGALSVWKDRLAAQGVTGLSESSFLGGARGRTSWIGTDVPQDAGNLGFRGAPFTLRDAAATGE